MSYRASRSLMLLLTLAAGVGGTLHAVARQTPPKKADAPPKPQSGVKTPKMAGLTMDDPQYDEKTDFLVGTNFVYTEDDMQVTGNRARYNKASKKLLAEGNLVMEDKKYRMTGDKADVDNSKGKKLAIIIGNVKILIKPKEKPAAPVGTTTGTSNGEKENNENVGDTRRRGGTITCDRVESFYKKEFSKLFGNLVFKQTITKKGKEIERTLTAEHAEYDGKAEKLTLFPPVKGSDTDGQEMEFSEIVYVGTKEGEENLESKRGKFTFRVEEDEEDDGKTPPPPANANKK